MKITIHLTGDPVLFRTGKKLRQVQRCAVCGLLIHDSSNLKEKTIRSGTWVKNMGKGKFVPIGESTNFYSFRDKEIPKNCCIRKF